MKKNKLAILMSATVLGLAALAAGLVVMLGSLTPMAAPVTNWVDQGRGDSWEIGAHWSAVNPAIVSTYPAGTPQNPVAISSANDLARIAFLVNVRMINFSSHPFSGGRWHFRVTSDINLEMHRWVAIGGTGGADFRGVFDGGHYTITMPVAIDEMRTLSEWADVMGNHRFFGLFGAVENAEIRNVRLDGDISQWGVATINQGRITSWQMDADLGTFAMPFTFHYGALVGRARNSTIENVVSDVNMSGMWTIDPMGVSPRRLINAGGVAGSVYNTRVDNVLTRGSIGGFVAQNNSPNQSEFTIGGVIGQAGEILTAYNLANHGAVQTQNADAVGGLIGRVFDGFLGNSYNRGDVRLENFGYVAGIVGRHSGNLDYFNIYNLGTVSTGNPGQGAVAHIHAIKCSVIIGDGGVNTADFTFRAVNIMATGGGAQGTASAFFGPTQSFLMDTEYFRYHGRVNSDGSVIGFDIVLGAPPNQDSLMADDLFNQMENGRHPMTSSLMTGGGDFEMYRENFRTWVRIEDASNIPSHGIPVRFYLNDGIEFTLYFRMESNIDLPADPTKLHHNFRFWSLEGANLQAQQFFPNDHQLIAPITLYASWESEQIIIRFFPNGGAFTQNHNAVDMPYVYPYAIYNEPFMMPTLPHLGGSGFLQWRRQPFGMSATNVMLDNSLIFEFDEVTGLSILPVTDNILCPVTGEVRLIAEWTDARASMTFNFHNTHVGTSWMNSGTHPMRLSRTVQVPFGMQSINGPSIPVPYELPEGVVFLGWAATEAQAAAMMADEFLFHTYAIAGGTNRWEVGESVLINATHNSQTLWAVYAHNANTTFDVTLHLGDAALGVTGGTVTNTFYYVQLLPFDGLASNPSRMILGNAPANAGFVFRGWATAADRARGVPTYAPNDILFPARYVVNNGGNFSIQNIVLYAMWEELFNASVTFYLSCPLAGVNFENFQGNGVFHTVMPTTQVHHSDWRNLPEGHRETGQEFGWIWQLVNTQNHLNPELVVNGTEPNAMPTVFAGWRVVCGAEVLVDGEWTTDIPRDYAFWITGHITLQAIYNNFTVFVPIPTGLAIYGTILSWNAVEVENETVTYRISINNQPHLPTVINTTSFNLNELALDVGIHYIRVIAVTGDSQSRPSAAVRFTMMETLDAPMIAFNHETGEASWGSITGADNYRVYVNSSFVGSTGVTSFNLTNCDDSLAALFTATFVTVHVVATSNLTFWGDSQESNTVNVSLSQLVFPDSQINNGWFHFASPNANPVDRYMQIDGNTIRFGTRQRDTDTFTLLGTADFTMLANGNLVITDANFVDYSTFPVGSANRLFAEEIDGVSSVLALTQNQLVFNNVADNQSIIYRFNRVANPAQFPQLPDIS